MHLKGIFLTKIIIGLLLKNYSIFGVLESCHCVAEENKKSQLLWLEFRSPFQNDSRKLGFSFHSLLQFLYFQTEPALFY
jgi:hypothetical protein